MISLSLQSSGHPTVFQHRPVRPSTPCYRGFSLPKDSSPGFWSTTSDEGARFGLAFAAAPGDALSHAGRDDSRTHYAKGMPQPRRATTPCRHTVSGLFHSPQRGSFRLSLAVLVRYRSPPSVQPWGMGPPDSDGVSRVPSYLGSRWASLRLRIRGFHPLWPAFPDRSPDECSCRVAVPQPQGASPLVWASGAFARRYLRHHCCFLLLRVLRCFTSPRLALPAYGFNRKCRGIAPGGLLHSETPGSMCVCHSPGLFAAYHVLLRLAVPRHPPCALSRLIVSPGLSFRSHVLGFSFL